MSNFYFFKLLISKKIIFHAKYESTAAILIASVNNS